jgi:hypothetical protein
VTGSGVPVVALSKAERRLVEGLRRAGAVNAGTARPLDASGLQGGRIDSLIDAGVVLQAAPGVYYVDEAAYQRYRQNKHVTMLAVIAALLLVGLIFAITTIL